MKILFVIETCGGGSGRHLLDLARGSSAQGHEVHVAFSPLRADAGFLRELASLRGVRRFPIEMRTAPGHDDLRALRRLKRYIQHMGPFDVIHGHSSKGGALARMAATWSRARRIYTPHALYTMNPELSPLKKKVYGAIEKLLANTITDSIILVSEEEHHHALEQGLPENKMRVIVNGVEARDEAELMQTRQRIRQQLGIDENVPVLGFVGRLDEQKAPERFIELAARLLPRHPTARFVMLGAGEKETMIRHLIDEYGLKNRVKLLTNASGEEFMPAFDLLLMTSRYEAMPYVLIEALAAHLPIVSTDVGGARTVIEDGVNGHIVPESDDISAMAELVSALLDDPDRLARYAGAAKRKAAAFREDRMVQTTLDHYASASG